VSQQWLLFRFTCRVLRMNCFWLTAHLFFSSSVTHTCCHSLGQNHAMR
jgi:hypothetical protein